MNYSSSVASFLFRRYRLSVGLEVREKKQDNNYYRIFKYKVYFSLH